MVLTSALGLCLCFTITKKSQAQAGFEYAYLAKFEDDGTCYWIANICTSDAGTTCTTPGTKSRGLKYCFPQ